MSIFTDEDSQSLPEVGLDLGVFGQRLRHLRRARGLTLAELGAKVGRAPSVLSLLENGRREPKLSLIEALAAALGVPADELMSRQPPSRRAQLEIALAQAQRDPSCADLGLPPLRAGARVPSEVIEHILALHAELRRHRVKPTATPEEARSANADLRNRRIYLRQEALGMHTPRAVLLQTLGHFVLGHSAPADFAEFLRQRIEANYFAAAVLVPEQGAAAFLAEAKSARELSVEDLRDVFSVSYEMAAHRFTNLATHHLGLPADETGAIEGQRMCRRWAGRQIFASKGREAVRCQYSDTPSGTYWCTS